MAAEQGRSPALLLETFLPYRLNIAAAQVSEGLARIYSARFHLDIPGWRVIATLGQFGEATAKTIGAHSRMHKTKVSRAVLDLETRGLLRRSPNPADKREAILALTQNGQSTYGEIVPLALAHQQDLLQRLTEDQRRALHGILAILCAPEADA